MRQLLVAAAAILLLVALVLRLEHRGGAAPGAVLADPVRTPGVLNPDVTQATIGSTICRHGWTRTIRPPVEYTDDLKHRQMRAYRGAGPPWRTTSSASSSAATRPIRGISGPSRTRAPRMSIGSRT